MAAEARREARRKRILENSNIRLQRIIDSQNSSLKTTQESIVRSSVDDQERDLSKNSENVNSNERLFSTVDQVETTLISSDPTDSIPLQETSKTQVQSDDYLNISTIHESIIVTVDKESSYGSRIRFSLNVLLAIVLVGVAATTRSSGFLTHFFGPWIGLQILMFSFSTLRQEISSSWLAVFKVALQLSGIPAHFTSALNTLYAFVILLLLDLPVFIFSTVMTVQVLLFITDLSFI